MIKTTDTFQTTEAAPKPTLHCVGRVGVIEEPRMTEGDKYVNIPINIEGLETGRSTKAYFLFRPEWLTKGFRPHTLKLNDSGAYFVYGKNIAAEDSFSLLRGIAGSKEAFNTLANTLLNLEVDEATGGPAIEDVRNALVDFVDNNVDSEGSPVLIGYTLVQQQKDTGETTTDDEGKVRKVYSRTNNYNLKNFWDVTTQNLKKKKANAEGSGVFDETGKKKVQFCYASGLPF